MKARRVGNVHATLRWMCELLPKENIPYQISGSVAAIAHGAKRSTDEIDLFVSAAQFSKVFRLIVSHVVAYAWRRVDDDWDRLTLSLEHDGTRVTISVAEGAQFREAATQEWLEAEVNLEASEMKMVFGIEVSIMPRDQLLDQMRRLDREIDRRDIRDITEASS